VRRARGRVAWASVVALAVGGIAAGCGDDDDSSDSEGGGDTTVKIGFSAALSGPYAAYDAPLLAGMEFAAQQIEADGGIDGYTAEIISKDNKGEQTQTATTTQELLDEGVQVSVLTTGDTSVPSGQLAVQAGGIASVGANTAPAIVQDVGERAFMIVMGDNAQAAAGAEYACDQGYASAYTIGSNEIPYTEFIPQYFEEAFAEGCDGQVTGSDVYKIGETNYGTVVAKIKAANPQPDVIYTPMFIPDFGAFVKQLRSAGVDTPVMTSDGNDSSLLLDSAGDAAEGVVFTTSTFPVEGSLAEEFIDEFTKETGNAPESNTLEAIGRDNVYAIVQAAADAGSSTDPDAILDAACGLTDYELVTGSLTMDCETQIPDKEVFVVEVKDGEFTYVDSFTPEFVPAP
jgi:branched-chain amino acid transport system substrate-binding protein